MVLLPEKSPIVGIRTVSLLRFVLLILDKATSVLELESEQAVHD